MGLGNIYRPIAIDEALPASQTALAENGNNSVPGIIVVANRI